MLFLVALRAVRSARIALRPALAWAVAFRLVLLAFGEPSLSDDVHRYLWDGAVLAAGLNPYQHAPADPRRAAFAPLAARVNHPEISTIYPPLAEAVFGLAAGLHPSERTIRAVLVLGDALVVLGLLGWLRARGRPQALVLAWAWCPLAVLETALGGHLDALAIGTLVLGLAWLGEGRRDAATLLLAASASLKLFALAVGLACVRRLGFARLAALVLLFLAGWLPFAAAGRGLVTGLGAYAARWQGNAPLFAGLVGALEASGSAERLKSVITWARGQLGHPAWAEGWYAHVYPQEVARLLVGLAFAAVTLSLARRGGDPLRAGARLALAFVLLTPTLHPWYGLWGLVGAMVLESRALLALTGLIALGYTSAVLALSDGVWREPQAVLAAEFLPFALLLWFDFRRGRFSATEEQPS